MKNWTIIENNFDYKTQNGFTYPQKGVSFPSVDIHNSNYNQLQFVRSDKVKKNGRNVWNMLFEFKWRQTQKLSKTNPPVVFQNANQKILLHGSTSKSFNEQLTELSNENIEKKQLNNLQQFI